MATPSNSFVRVGTADPAAVTVTIRGSLDRIRGEVIGPSPVAGGAGVPVTVGQDGSLGAHEAVAVGCQLANELGCPVVVIDDGENWRPAWGRLERA